MCMSLDCENLFDCDWKEYQKESVTLVPYIVFVYKHSNLLKQVLLLVTLKKSIIIMATQYVVHKNVKKITNLYMGTDIYRGDGVSPNRPTFCRCNHNALPFFSDNHFSA